MLLNFRLNNFKSFGEPQDFTATPYRYKKHNHHVYVAEKYKALKFSAIFGANASGKSNFVEAVAFLKYLVRRGRVPYGLEVFKYKLEDMGKFTEFEIEVGFDDKILIYGISIDLSQIEVNREYLYFNTGGVDKIVFDIDKGSLSLAKIKQEAKKRIDIYVDDLKQGELLLKKLADAKDVDEEVFKFSKELYEWITRDLVVIKPTSSNLDSFGQFIRSKDEEVKYSVIDILRTFDTGITDYVYREIPIEKFLDIVNEMAKDSSNDEILDNFYELLDKFSENQFLETNIGGDFYRISFDKKIKKPIVQTLGFTHCNKKDVYFSYDEESDGTKRLIEIVNVLYNVQNNNKTYVIDEIERSFHSNLTIEFIEKFLTYSKENSSQLIITTHETNVMNLNLVRQDELWLIDRNKKGMSSLVSLSDFNIRYDKVLDKDYLLGRYGGVPELYLVINEADNNE